MTEDAVPALTVTNLRTSFQAGRRPPLPAVRGVSFTLRKGERLGIVGESGSGKSVLALSLLGLVDPPGKVVSGRVELSGRSVMDLGDRAFSRLRGRDLALVYQDPMSALNPLRTIGAQVAESVRLHRAVSRNDARETTVDLLAKVGISQPRSRLGQYPHEFSGGMRQRVVIAMAMANSPSVLIADEPTTALDVTSQAQVLDLLERMSIDSGSAIILISHDLAVVTWFCERIAVMYGGRFVEVGDCKTVLTSPRHHYTAALISARPRPTLDGVRRKLATIPGAPPPLSLMLAGCPFEPRCPKGNGDQKCLTQPPDPRVMSNGSTIECHYPVEEQS